MTNKRPRDDDDDEIAMPSDQRKNFVNYLHQPDLCELFYNYMKSEELAYVLEFYLACDGLKTLDNHQKNLHIIIKLIYKHYLSDGKALSSSSSKKCSLPNCLLSSIKQRLRNHEYHIKFYNQAQEYVLNYMLENCYSKFLRRQRKDKQQQQVNVISTDNKFKTQYNLAQQNPTAFFQELKQRLLTYQLKHRMIEDDPAIILDLQIAKTIDDADNYLSEKSITRFIRYDSGVGTDSSEKYSDTMIDVIWYPSLESNQALLSTIPYNHRRLTFKEFRYLFQKQKIYRYFFKTICTPDINREQYVFREVTMDDELIPFYDGKIFVRLDRLY